jgi:hypothetical protein
MRSDHVGKQFTPSLARQVYHPLAKMDGEVLADPGDEIRILSDLNRIAVAELDPDRSPASASGHDAAPDLYFLCARRSGP